jgi:CRP-like cAMP-binding protein
MSNASTIKLIEQVPLFAGITESEATALSLASEKRQYKRGDCLVEQGHTTLCLYVILSGRADVILRAGNGKQFNVATLGAGECFGEMSILDNEPHCATVSADGNMDVLVLSQFAFNEVLQQNSNITASIFHTLATRLHTTTQQIVRLSTVSVLGRVARSLMDLASVSPRGELLVKGKISNVVLADKVGASRKMVGNALRELEGTGFIEKLPGGSIRINDKRTRERP